MLYRFQSAACGDVIMLAAVAEPILKILGRERQRPGIIQAEDCAAARQTLLAAIAQQEADWDAAKQQARTEQQPAPKRPALGLRQRCHTLLIMLERSQAHKQPVTWQ